MIDRAIVLLTIGVVVAACSPSEPVATATTTSAPPRPSTTTTLSIDYVAYVEDALDFMEEQHYRSDEVNWAAVRDETMAIVHSDPTAVGAYRALESAVTPSREHPALWATHTWFWRPEEAAAWNSLDSTTASDPPSGRRLADYIGYVNLPSVHITTDQYPTYAGDVRAVIETIDSAAPVCGWIIDLRSHTGGDGIVGLAGLGPLLGQGPIIRFAGNDQTTELTYRDDQVLSDGEPVTDRRGQTSAYSVVDGHIPDAPDAPVAVLTSGVTASAGEMLLVAFLGRPETRVFGEPTAGAPTAGRTLVLSDGAELWVTAVRYQDRLGRTYDESIHPDQTVLTVPGDPDESVQAATHWLLATNSCSN